MHRAEVVRELFRRRSSPTAAPELPEADSPETAMPQEAPGGGKILTHLQLVWSQRGTLYRVGIYALVTSTLLAFLVPARYESTARLMPPDNQSASGLAAAAALTRSAGGLGGAAGEFLGLKSTSDVFVGILSSRTVQDGLIQQFDLKKLYRDRRMADARKDLADHTSISVDRKSQIIGITVTDRSPQRAAAMVRRMWRN